MDTPTEKIDHPNKWFLGIKRRGDDILDLSGITPIYSSLGFYTADPFVIKKDGVNWLFYELYDYQRGIIICSKINGLKLEDAKVVMDMPWHISFPSVFEDEGKYYMTPEEGKSGYLNIYECAEWPNKWEKINEISSGLFGDPVIFKDGNRYKCYVTTGDNHLFIYGANTLDGKWGREYTREEMYARSAGHIFRYDGKWIRPTQNAEGSYGSGVILKDLNGNVIQKLKNDWHEGLAGFHTFNFNEDYIVVDGRL